MKSFLGSIHFPSSSIPNIPRSSLAKVLINWGFPGGSDGKESACNARDLGLIPMLGRSLEKGMTTHSSILAWRIPWTEESDGLQSMRLQRAGND